MVVAYPYRPITVGKGCLSDRHQMSLIRRQQLLGFVPGINVPVGDNGQLWCKRSGQLSQGAGILLRECRFKSIVFGGVDVVQSAGSQRAENRVRFLYSC